MEPEFYFNRKCTPSHHVHTHVDGELARIAATRPRLWSVFGNLSFSLLLFLLALATGLLRCTETLGPDSDLILTVTATALLAGAIFGSTGLRLLKQWRHPEYYCLILTSDRILEQTGKRLTSIPRERLIAAWDKGGRCGGVALLYRNLRDEQDVWVAHNAYPQGRTLPSPAIRRIQTVYGLPDPAQEDEY